MSRSPTAFFVGQSPLQILNLVEASRAYGLRGPMLVVYDEDAIRSQIESLLVRLQVDEVTYQRRDLLFRMGFPLILALRYAHLRGRVDTVFFGTYTGWASFLVNLLKARRHVLIDDGQKTINIITSPQLVGLTQRRTRSLLSRAYVDEAEFFTFYDELARRHGRIARPNRLQSVAADLMQGGIEGIEPAGRDDIVFIGTNVADAYAPFDDAMRHVMAAATGRRLLYLMHRRDDATRIAKLARALGFEARRFDLPIELVFHHLWSTHRPAVWTFGTTATDTLQAMEPTLNVRVFRLDRAGFRSMRLADSYDSIYAHYAAANRVELVPLGEAVADSSTERCQTASK
jgi:hypothetical protein